MKKSDKEVAYIEAIFTSPMQWHLDDYEEELAEAGVDSITMDDIKEVFIKHGECTIYLKNDEIIELGQGLSGVVDYKWPDRFGLYNDRWIKLREEG